MQEMLNSGSVPAILSLVVVAAMFILFLRESFPVEVTALTGVVVLISMGVLPVSAALEVFSNPAPWTIAAMFIISGGLVRTGALNALTGVVRSLAKRGLVMVLIVFSAFVLVSSAFVNNTPVVVMLIPVAVALAKERRIASSRLLIPLSYVAILGGMCTLIGTSTNLLVDGVAQAQGLRPFTLFEVTKLGVILALFGVAYLGVIGLKLLPDRVSMAELLIGRKRMSFFTEVAIPQGSTVIGQSLMQIDLFRREDMRVVDLIRGDASLRRRLDEVVVEEGDRVVLKTSMEELLSLKDSDALQMVDRLSSRKSETVEALISPGCRLVGRSLGSLRLRRRYGVYPLAVHRRNQNIGSQLDDVVIRVGDTLLLEGAPEDIQRLAADVELIDIAQPAQRALRRTHAPIVLAVLAGIVLLAAMGVAEIFPLALGGVAIILITRCIDAEEAFGAVDGRLLVLIFSMLAIGAAMQHSGAVVMIVEAVVPALEGLPPWALIWAVYLLTSILTEMVSNNAVAVVVTPVAIAVAQSLGIDPRPLVVAVMVAASASFATPIGYQTNTLVYGPGGYKFTDYVKIGAPLNLCIGLLASLLIPVFWEL